MLKCINWAHPLVKEVNNKYGELITLSLWIENNKEDIDIDIADKLYEARKNKNKYLELSFESNPELANVVYEALGFETTSVDFTPTQLTSKPIGSPLDQSEGTGICDGTCGLMAYRLEEAGMPYGHTQIEDKVANYHAVALTEIDGKRYILNQPQHEFLSIEYQKAPLWERAMFWRGMSQRFNRHLPRILNDLYFSEGINPYPALFGTIESEYFGEIGPIFKDKKIIKREGYSVVTGTLIENPSVRIAIKLEEGETLESISPEEADVQTTKDGEKIPVWTKTEFTPRFIEVTKENLIKEYQLTDKQADVSIKAINEAIINPGTKTQITPQQKQQAQQLYSQYLDTIFPDSKVTLSKKFADTYNIIFNGETIGTIYIPSDLDGDTVSIGDVNIKPEFRGKGLGVETYKAAMKVAGKPLESFMATEEANRVWNSLIKQGLAKKTNTGFVTITPLSGSKQDIEGFKNWIKDKKNFTDIFKKDLNFERILFNNQKTTTSVEILERIANSNLPLNKLAQSLIKYAKLNNVSIFLDDIDGYDEGENGEKLKNKASGYYQHNKIRIAKNADFKAGDATAVILHEILHSITKYELTKNTNIRKDFDKLYQEAKSKLGERYALTDLDEFLVALFTNGTFQTELSELPPLSGVKKYKNLLEEIMDFLLSIINISKKDTLYTQAFAVATNIIDDFKNSEEVKNGYYNELNKVIESKKIIKEIFDKNPELDKIGSIEDYYRYLKSISPNGIINDSIFTSSFLNPKLDSQSFRDFINTDILTPMSDIESVGINNINFNIEERGLTPNQINIGIESITGHVLRNILKTNKYMNINLSNEEYKKIFDNTYSQYIGWLVSNSKDKYFNRKAKLADYLRNNKQEATIEINKLLNKITGIKFLEDDINFENEEKREITKTFSFDNDNGISLDNNASGVLKMALASISVYNNNDFFGPMPGIADYNKLLSIMANKLAFVPHDIDLYIQGIKDIINTTGNKELSIFLDKVLANYDNNNPDLDHFNFLGTFMKAMDLQKQEIVIGILKEDGDMSLLNPISNSDVNYIREESKQNYYEKYNANSTTEKFINELDNVWKNLYKKNNKGVKTTLSDVYKVLGIDLSTKFDVNDSDNYTINFNNDKLTYYQIAQLIVQTYSKEKYKAAIKENVTLPFLFADNSPLKNRLDKLFEDQSNYREDNKEASYLNGSGDLDYALKPNDNITNFVTKVNYINETYANNSTLRKAKLKYTFSEFNIDNHPEFAQSSWYKNIVENGFTIDITYQKEIKNTNDTTLATSLSKLDPVSRFRIFYKSVLESAVPLLRPADRSIITNFRFSKNGQPKNVVVSEFNTFRDQMLNHLNYEIITAQKYLNLTKTGKSLEFAENLKKLRVFDDIITDQNLKDEINQLISGEREDIPSVWINENKTSLTKELEIWFETAFLLEKNELTNSGSLKTYEEEGKKYVYLLDKTIQDSPSFNLNNTIKKVLMTTITQSLEQTYFITGDVGQYKTKGENLLADILKRVKLFNATRQNFNLSERALNWLENADNGKWRNPFKSDRTKLVSYITEDNFIKGDSAKKIAENVEKAILKNLLSITGSENFKNNIEKYAKEQADAYLKGINTADGYSVCSFSTYRDIRLLSNSWTKNHEHDYQILMKYRLTKNKELLKNLKGASFEILKTQGAGSIQDIKNLLNLKTTYKHALMPLNPLLIEGTILENLHSNMLEQQVDLLQFESAVKTGAIKFDNKFLKFPTNLQDLKEFTKTKTQTINMSDFGIQVETDTKEFNMVTSGKQLRIMILANLYKDGKLINEGNKTLVENYFKSQKELTQQLNYEALTGLGFNVDEKTGLLNDTNNNRKLLVKFLRDNTESIDNNYLVSIDKLLDEDITIDYMQNMGKIISQLLSKPRKATTNQKVPGLMGILASFTGFKYSTGGKTSNNLKWYESSKRTGETLACEIYLKIPKQFVKLLKSKYKGNLDALNADVEKANQLYRDYHNGKNVKLSDSPIPIELLTITGFRIPTQAYSSIELMMIKKFLPESSGDTVVAPEEITVKTGSDFDVDKLTMYLPKFEVSGNNIYFKEDVDTIYKNLQKDLESFKNYLNKKIREEKNNFEDEISSEFINNILGEDSKEIIIELKEGIITRLKEKLKKQQEKFNFNVEFEKEIKDKLRKNVLYNNLLSSQIELLKLQEQLGNLLNPVTDNTLKNLINNIRTLKETEKDSIPYSSVLLPSFNVAFQEKFIKGKTLIGAIANALRSHVSAQKAGLFVKDSFAEILFKHNTVNILNSETEELEEKISLGGNFDVDNTVPILSLLSEFGTAFVDIAKDPYIFELIHTEDGLSTILYLLRAGVNDKVIVMFLQQESVKEFLLAKQLNESPIRRSLGTFIQLNELELNQLNYYNNLAKLTEFNNKDNRSLSSIYGSFSNGNITKKTITRFENLLSIYKDNNIDLDTLMDNLKPNKSKSEEYYQSQAVLLDLFIYYSKQAKNINSLSNLFKDDTLSLKSIDEIVELEDKKLKLWESEFFGNLDIYEDENILKSFSVSNNQTTRAVSSLLLTQDKNIIVPLNEVKNKLTSFNFDNDYSNVARIVNTRFIDYLLQNFYEEAFPNDLFPINKKGASILMDKNNPSSVPNRLLKIKTDINHPLHRNLLIKQLQIDKSRKKQDNIKIFTNKFNTFTSQNLINAYNEIKETDPELAINLLKFNLLQSGKLFSKISFLDTIDANDYYKIIIPVLDIARNRIENFTKEESFEFFENFQLKVIEAHPSLLSYAGKISVTVFNSDEVVYKNKSLFDSYDIQVKAKLIKQRFPVYESKKGIALEKELEVLSSEKRTKQTKEKIKKIKEELKNIPASYYTWKIIPLVFNPELSDNFNNRYSADYKNAYVPNSDETWRVDMTNDNLNKETPTQVVDNNQLQKQNIDFQEEPTTGYKQRTINNAKADATIAIAVDFNSAGEKLTKSSVLNQNKKYIPIDANTLTVTKERVDKIVEALNSVNAKTLNIAGNGIYTMKGKYTQQQVDNFTYDLLNQVINSPNLKTKIESIRSGGQTGFDEAGAKAGIKLGLPTIVLAPKGWTFRNINGQDISNEQQFKDRFKNISQVVDSGIDESKKINIYAGTNENAELSNFAIRPFEDKTEWKGLTFKTVEGAFQAAKLQLSDMYDKNDNLTKEGDELLDKLQIADGATAKDLGRKITGLNVREWDRLSLHIMKGLLLESFKQNPKALEQLLATGNAELTHTQDKGKWGKEFPKLLMEVRQELKPKVVDSNKKIEDETKNIIKSINNSISQKDVDNNSIQCKLDF